LGIEPPAGDEPTEPETGDEADAKTDRPPTEDEYPLADQ
jgi:hypothetical protein